MAAPRRRPEPPLEQTLFEEPYRFEFFQAVRLLSRLDPNRVPVGREGPPRRESVRFRGRASLAFPASEVHHLEQPADGDGPPVMTVAFLGLTGPVGVLPQCYTEFQIERNRAGDQTFTAFLDLFQHRLISLFYRAWEKYRPPIPFERGEGGRVSQYLFDLIGLGTPGLRERHRFDDDALLFYTGFLAQRHRPAIVLEQLLRDHFGWPIEVQQFVGQWLKLEPGDRSILGPDGPNNGLGTSLILGDRVWDEQGKFRLRVGPLTFDQFQALSPDGTDFPTLAEMTRLFVDAELVFDVQLVLRADEVPACQLTSAPGRGPQLGRHAWLKGREFTNDADDAVFPSGL